jgi:pimeloyl-ACP methyl ester carboxylesterase
MERQAHDLDVDGTRIRLWARVPDGAETAVLLVHGATYPGRVVFDLDVPGADATYSWLADVAARGRAAVAVDLRGYGDSDRPPAMDAPADENPPPARADVVVEDVRTALDHLRSRYDRTHLVGYSWGSLVCGRLLAAPHAPAVASLTQFAPVFRMDPTVVARFDPGDPAPAYRTATRETVAARWNDQVPDDADPATWRGGPDDAVFDAFWTQFTATGQGSADGIRAPNGTLLDLRETVDAAPYDPAAIAPPTLVVRGSEDPTATRADALGLYDALDGDREYAEVGGGTHFLPVEARRGALFDVVAGFHARV